MTSTIFVIILITHWIADFVLQSDEIAKSKSSSFKSLTEHGYEYMACWLLPSLYIFYEVHFAKILAFLAITFLSHVFVDYFTSKLNTRLYKNNERHWFFVSIGFDQVLHYLQLWFTINYFL